MIKKSKKMIEREKLLIWRNAVVNRDNYKCQICKHLGINTITKPRGLSAHHIIPKHYKDLKYDIMNGITLCFNHHKVGKMSAHMNSIFFTLFLQNYKKEQYVYLKNKL